MGVVNEAAVDAGAEVGCELGFDSGVCVRAGSDAESFVGADADVEGGGVLVLVAAVFRTVGDSSAPAASLCVAMTGGVGEAGTSAGAGEAATSVSANVTDAEDGTLEPMTLFLAEFAFAFAFSPACACACAPDTGGGEPTAPAVTVALLIALPIVLSGDGALGPVPGRPICASSESDGACPASRETEEDERCANATGGLLGTRGVRSAGEEGESDGEEREVGRVVLAPAFADDADAAGSAAPPSSFFFFSSSSFCFRICSSCSIRDNRSASMTISCERARA